MAPGDFTELYPYDVPTMLSLGASLSLRERGADAAAYDFEAWLKCEYAKDHLDTVMAGTVTAVTHFGLFVTLDDLRLAGLLHVTQLPDDYYHFEEVDRRLTGERGAGDFALGDRLKVRLSQVDSEERRIDLAFEAQLSRGPRPARRGRRKTVEGRTADRRGSQARGPRKRRR
jgi:ribonuclease R